MQGLLSSSPTRDIGQTQHHQHRVQPQKQGRAKQGRLSATAKGIGPSSSLLSSPNRQKSPSNEQQQREYEMLIHPESIKGTTAAAASHIHGQTGGRQAATCAVSNNDMYDGQYYDGNCSMMNSRAILLGAGILLWPCFGIVDVHSDVHTGE